MRKHFYLITEHEKEDRIGGVSIHDTQSTTPNKNEEAPIRVLDDEKEGSVIIGKKVGLGYHDFESEDEYEDNEVVAKVIQSKIRDVDRGWAVKAGVEDTVYGDSE